MDKNLSANANSINPNTTFTVFNQPPDLGNEFNHLGNMANNVKGNAKASPKPPIPILNCIALASDAMVLPNNPPRIGPVQEKETIAKVSAIKNTPITPPILLALLSIAALQDCGSVNSKYPKNENENTTNTIKKIMFSVTLVDMVFRIPESNESITWKGTLKST